MDHDARIPRRHSTDTDDVHCYRSLDPCSSVLLPLPTTAPVIAVLIPCYNEELTVATVVRNFQRALPEADVYVYDNNSTDRTVEMAASAGAVVSNEPFQGKGNVVRPMFGDIDADIYLLVDGDDTYDTERARKLVNLLLRQQLDMVNAARVRKDNRVFRSRHRFGNQLLTGIVTMIFGDHLTDMLSGYKEPIRITPRHGMQ